MSWEPLTRVLDEDGARYELLPHAHTERAADEAKALGLSPDEVAKTLVVRTPAGNVRAIVSAADRLDRHKLAEVLGARPKAIDLLSEDELARDYPEFDLGAVPPVGGSREDEVIIDSQLARREQVVLEAGTHDESLRMLTEDLLRVAKAKVADIAQE